MGIFSSKPAARVETGVGCRRHTPDVYPQDVFAAIQAAVRDGIIVMPGDAGYDHARRAWNLDATGFPSAVCTVGSKEDISRLLKAASRHTEHIHIAVTGNGRHSRSCVPDNALVIDLSRFDAIQVDAENRTATVEAGAVLKDIDAALFAYNMMLTLGQNPHTGITGLCLGGGLGLGARTTGMTSDNILEAEVVLATGETAIASERAHSDLLWALRGGGGNFGVVTQFKFRIHPIGDTVYCGDHVYPPIPLPCLFSNPVSAMKRSVGYIESSSFPREMTGNLIICCHGPFIGNWVYMGDVDAGRRVFNSPDMAHGRTQIKTDKPRPYVEAQQMSLGPDGMGQQASYYHERGVVVDSISDAMVEEMWNQCHANGTPRYGSAIIITLLGGAMGDVKPDASAFFNRHMKYFVVVLAEWKKPEEADAARQWSRDLANTLGRYSAMPYNPPLGEAAPVFYERDVKVFGTNLPRLKSIKKVYDPENIFKHNNNIVPEFVPKPEDNMSP